MPAARSFQEHLAGNAYPGRGIFIGLTPDAKNAVLAYFIMGRSENSRARRLEEAGESLVIRPAGTQALLHPELVLYTPLRVYKNDVILANGDQSDTIRDFLAAGKSFEAALQTRRYEPDAPHYTPRISALAQFGEKRFQRYTLSILACADGKGGDCERRFYSYTPEAGRGHFLSTYLHDGDPLPSYTGAPAALRTENDMEACFEAVWQALDRDNRVALWVRYMEPATGRVQSRLRNRHAAE